MPFNHAFVVGDVHVYLYGSWSCHSQLLFADGTDFIAYVHGNTVDVVNAVIASVFYFWVYSTKRRLLLYKKLQLAMITFLESMLASLLWCCYDAVVLLQPMLLLYLGLFFLMQEGIKWKRTPRWGGEGIRDYPNRWSQLVLEKKVAATREGRLKMKLSRIRQLQRNMSICLSPMLWIDSLVI